MSVSLLLFDEDSNAPLLEQGVPDETLADTPRYVAPTALPDVLYSTGRDWDDLHAQRWGVVVPEDGGDDLLAAIAPLIETRAHQQKLAAGEQTRIYRVPNKVDPYVWMHENLKSSDLKRPRYLLILGDVDRISLEFQTALADSKYLPGRLVFDRIEDYHVYAQKVLFWENPDKAAEAARVALLTACVKDRNITNDAYERLMKPAFDLAQQYQENVEDGYSFVLQDATTEPPVRLETLLATARDATQPTVLWTISHGSPFYRGSLEEIRLQRGNLKLEGGYLTPEMVAKGPFLPGGIWFIFACFGAATPARSVYWQWLDRALLGKSKAYIENQKATALESLANDLLPPFVSALPKALLANPEGPLAVIGHADLAWVFSYDDLVGTGTEPRVRFLEMPSLLADPGLNKRVGHAFAMFRECNALETRLNGYYADIDEALIKTGKMPDIDLQHLGKLWMHRQDIAQYMLLGDPAVRLPLKRI